MNKPIYVILLVPIFLAGGAFGIIAWTALNPSDRAKNQNSKLGLNYDGENLSFQYESATEFADPLLSHGASQHLIDSQYENSEKNSKLNSDSNPKGKNSNLALNKPIAQIFFNVEVEKSFDEKQKKDEILLKLDPQRLKSHVLFYEQRSVNLGGYPSYLNDGDHGTRAYPADYFFDYVVDLRSLCKLSEIRLDWGNFGFSEGKHNYITGWELYSQETFSDNTFPSKSDWVLVTRGSTPGEGVTPISEKYLEKPVRRLRIRAWSEPVGGRNPNWIGIHEMEVFGSPLKN